MEFVLYIVALLKIFEFRDTGTKTKMQRWLRGVFVIVGGGELSSLSYEPSNQSFIVGGIIQQFSPLFNSESPTQVCSFKGEFYLNLLHLSYRWHSL